MPRKTLRRWLPDPHKIVDSRAIRWMGPLLRDPNLFHINRTSISASFFIGLFCAFLPIPGQTLIAALLALFFRTNKRSGTPTVGRIDLRTRKQQCRTLGTVFETSSNQSLIALGTLRKEKKKVRGKKKKSKVMAIGANNNTSQ